MAKTHLSDIAQYAPCTIYVRGQVAFSRVASFVEGEELANKQREAQAKGRIAPQKPYISITIKNPMVVDNGKLPEMVKTVIQDRFYPSKTENTMLFSLDSKSPYLPSIAYSTMVEGMGGQGIADRNVPLKAELANGLDITIGMNLFKSSYGNPGLGLNCIFVNEPIRYYMGSSMESEFAAMGVTYVPPTAPANAAPVAKPAPAPVISQPVPTAEAYAPQPYAAPIPAAPQYQPTPQQYTPPQTTQTYAPYQPEPQQYAAPQQTYTAPQVQQYSAPPQNMVAQMPPFPLQDEDIPFNPSSTNTSLGVEPRAQRPTRYY